MRNYRLPAALAATLSLLGAALYLLDGPALGRIPRRGDTAAPSYTILCLGDSYTYGAGAQALDSYPAQLENLLRARFPGAPLRVINDGRMAQNTAELLRELPGELEKFRPDLVVILSGADNYWNFYGYRGAGEGPGRAPRPAALFVKLYRVLAREIRYLSGPAAGLSAGRAPAAGGRDIGAWLRKDLEAAVSAASARGAGVIVAGYPPVTDPGAAAASLAISSAAFAAAGFLDLSAAFPVTQDNPTKASYLSPGGRYPSATGYGEIARRAAEKIGKMPASRSPGSGGPGGKK